LGPSGERADRDFRKQTIMTMRTLLLENALTSFMTVLLGVLNIQVSLDCILRVLFERSGARMETNSHGLYWVNTTGLSVAYQRLLAEGVKGGGTMDLRHQGKPIGVRLKALFPLEGSVHRQRQCLRIPLCSMSPDFLNLLKRGHENVSRGSLANPPLVSIGA